jgi:flagellar biosynthesis protein
MSHLPRPRAAALSYDAEEDAILELARRHGVPVRSDPALCSLLSVLEIGDEVPPELYEAVARLVACLVELETELAGGEGVVRDPVTGEAP